MAAAGCLTDISSGGVVRVEGRGEEFRSIGVSRELNIEVFDFAGGRVEAATSESSCCFSFQALQGPRQLQQGRFKADLPQ